MGDVVSRVGLGCFWRRLSGPEPLPQVGSISLKFSLETKLKFESCEPLVDFLTLLVHKLTPKKQYLDKYLFG